MLVAVVVLAGLPVVLATSTASAAGPQASVSTVAEFWAAWTDPDVTQIDLLNDIDLITYNNDSNDYSTCDDPGEDTYPERHTNGDTLVDGHGFTLTMTCTDNAVLDSFGAHTLTVQDITVTHAGLTSGNGIAMEDLGGDVVVIDSTIVDNWVDEDSCGSIGAPAVGTASLCIPLGGGIAGGGDVTVSGSTIARNRTSTFGVGIFANGFLTVTDSVIAENIAEGTIDQDAFGGGGAFANEGALVDGVRFEGNLARCPGDCEQYGGGLVTGPARVTNSSFTDNSVGCQAFCTNVGGAVYVVGDLDLAGSTFENNEASCFHGCAAAGAGIYADGSSAFDGATVVAAWGAAGLAAAIEPGEVTIVDSEFSGNRGTILDDPIYFSTCECAGGGLAVNGETAVSVTGSTFSGNEAYGSGGAVSIAGAVPLALTNSTLTGNVSRRGAVTSEGPVTTAYVTITDNVIPPPADELEPDPITSMSVGELRSFATVVVGAGSWPNCFVDGSSTSEGWNFSDDSSCGFTDAAKGDSEAAGNDPKLGVLADNGGPTRTRLPAPASPLLDRIPIASCQAGVATGVTTDQRGVTRPQGTGCDIGAVEVVVPVPVIQPTFTG
ncbi:MAG: choice-of-anchor Q domain-containing protein [Acidimicrobiia bacterium]|jgi:hypothetical protein